MRVAIKQIHLEQDSGRIQYNPRDPEGNTTVVDFSRSGVPPMMSLAHTHTHLMYSSGYTYLGVYGCAVMIFIACTVQVGSIGCGPWFEPLNACCTLTADLIDLN